MTKASPPIRIFVSYSHDDRNWFSKLRPLLVFTNAPTDTVHAWHDNELKAGERWDDEIRKELDRMDLFLCLVSSYFIASRYIREVELPAALERERAGITTIVPLLLDEMDERDIAYLKPFSPLPAWGRSWCSYKKRGAIRDAHKPIRSGLLDAIEKVQLARAQRTGSP